MDAALRAAAATARLTGSASRLLGFGGTSLPGKVLLRLQPRALSAFAATLSEGVALISATNGKTTTASLAKGILERSGVSVVGNSSGANMAGGIAAALLERRDAQFGLFEVDELWLPKVLAALSPRVVVLSNLLRDQLDRYGELELIAKRWQDALAKSPAQLVLCADDPLIASLGEAAAHPPLFFGLEDPAVATNAAVHAVDARHCRRCGEPLRFDRYFIAHLGHYRCDRCGFERPRPQIAAQEVELAGLAGSSFLLTTPTGAARVRLTVPGLYNVYNALAAAALSYSIGTQLETIAAALGDASPAFGRAERIAVGGREVVILLIKNPAGATEVVRTLALEPGRLDLLFVLNDRIADGRDVSWIWDAELEPLAEKVGSLTCAGTRAEELALRLKYAGVATSRIVAITTDLSQAVDAAVAAGDRNRPLFALPTYTAMLELRKLLGRGGSKLRRGG